MDPNQVCDQLLNYVKMSGLNFYLYESPFGVTVNVKKSFIKGKNGDVVIAKHSFFHQVSRGDEKPFVEKIESLNCTIADLNVNQDTLNDTIEDLDQKLQHSKGEISDLLFEREEFVKAREEAETKLSDEMFGREKLKDTIKVLKEEKEELLKEKKTMTNIIKAKDKEVHNLTVKNDNLTFNLSNIKAEKFEISNEKTKIAKELTKLKKKGVRIYSSSSKSTNTASTPISNVGTNTSISSRNTSTNTMNLSSMKNQELDSNQNLTNPSESLKLNTSTNLAASFAAAENLSCSPVPADDEKTKVELEMKLEELKAANEKLLEGVTEDELIFTVEEMTALGLDWNIHEEIANYLKKNF